MKVIFNPKEAEKAIDFVFKNNPAPCADNKIEVGKTLYRLLKQMGEEPDLEYIATAGFHLIASGRDEETDEKFVDILVTPSFGNDDKYFTMDVQ